MKTITSSSQPAQQTKKSLPNGPPEDIEASELVALLTTLPRPNKIVPYPRKLPGSKQPISHLAIVAAMSQEKIFALSAAQRYTIQVLTDPKKAKESGQTKLSEEEIASIGYQGIFKNAVAVELLSRACMTAVRKKGARSSSDILGSDDYEMKLPMEPAFPGSRWMREHCTDDEIGVLSATYNRTQIEIGPIVAMLSDEEADLWLEKLIVGGVALDPFDSLALGAVTDLLMRSVHHLRNYRKDSSSSGEQLGNGYIESRSSSDLSEDPNVGVETELTPEVETDDAPPVEALPIEKPGSE